MRLNDWCLGLGSGGWWAGGVETLFQWVSIGIPVLLDTAIKYGDLQHPSILQTRARTAETANSLHWC